MKPNWFAVNRSVVENPLFKKKPLWGWAWLQILASTERQTSRVCLTDVYRALSPHFTYSQWRHLVQVFVKDGMLHISETYNLGEKAGHRQVAIVVNWEVYQPQKERRASDSASDSASAEPVAEPTDDRDDKKGTSAQSQRSASDSASAEPVAEVLQEVKEVKELKKEPPLTPPKSKKAKPLAHDFDPETVDLPDNFDRERFVDFCAMRLQKKDPLSELAVKRFIRINQNYSAPVLNRMFDNAIVPGWKALYPLKPWEQEEAELTPVPKPETERLPPGTPVHHPVWGDDVIRFYRQDGQMVLDECGALVRPNEVVSCPN